MSDDAFIRLENVSKVYPGETEPAVAELDLAIPKGEILVLVGPSGCGKSTTLRLINRMIEPSGGRIIFEGEDVTTVNADQLRRRIGYVIQQIGLFPHRTIAENIATVPRLLGWDAARIDARVDELLQMVGRWTRRSTRTRYPRELSGGQAQRVGVARALGADPDVLLMDEPFGAIDPITRDRLQNEFLACSRNSRRRSCSSPTTSTRPSRWATASPSSASSPASPSTTRRSDPRPSRQRLRRGLPRFRRHRSRAST
jgi:osmoprotectant transport system ATP-binding protein